MSTIPDKQLVVKWPVVDRRALTVSLTADPCLFVTQSKEAIVWPFLIGNLQSIPTLERYLEFLLIIQDLVLKPFKVGDYYKRLISTNIIA